MYCKDVSVENQYVYQDLLLGGLEEQVHSIQDSLLQVSKVDFFCLAAKKQIPWTKRVAESNGTTVL